MVASVLVLGILLNPAHLQAQAIECEPCNFTPLAPETFVEIDLSFVVLGKDFNQEIQGIISPLWDGLVGPEYDARGLVSVGLSTTYDGSLHCPMEEIPLQWRGLDIIETALSAFNPIDLLSPDNISNDFLAGMDQPSRDSLNTLLENEGVENRCQ